MNQDKDNDIDVPSTGKIIDLPDEMKRALILSSQQRWWEAGECYRSVLERDGGNGAVYYLYGNCLRFQGEMGSALQLYRKAQALLPDSVGVQWALCMSLFKEIYCDEEELRAAREEYTQKLTQLHEKVMEGDETIYRELIAHIGLFHPFYLPYQGGTSDHSVGAATDCELQRLYGEMVARVMGWHFPRYAQMPVGSDTQASSQSPATRFRAKGQRLRLGFLSRFFYQHSVWQMPLSGWLESFNREEIEVFCYQTHDVEDEITHTARMRCDHWIGGLSEPQLVERIGADQLDVLIYPEIGMDPVGIRLSGLRLAPIQCTSWGHPITSGMPTIDYYLSSESMEPEASNSHYTEKLVRLKGLSVVLQPPKIALQPLSLNDRGIRSDSIKYLCCQSLYKYLPLYDWIWPSIACKVPKAQFIIIDCEPSLTHAFRERLRPHFAAKNLDMEEHLVAIPWLNSQEMAFLYKACDIFLDSIGWSGCNTSMEAIGYNLPIITLPQDTMRSRHTLAFLNQMGATRGIASDLLDYVRLAIEGGSQVEWRAALIKQIEMGKQSLYSDTRPVEALERWLLSQLPLSSGLLGNRAQ